VNRIDRRKREINERILQAAFDLFLVQGVTATTIEEICERADVANRTFFNHFPTRHAMMAAVGRGSHRGSGLHQMFVEMVNVGITRGEVTTRHDPQTLAGIITSALSGPIGNWTVDPTYPLDTSLHDTARALADLLSLDAGVASARHRP
jgi:hypothetical protein